jgi:hypothetical protein
MHLPIHYTIVGVVVAILLVLEDEEELELEK